MFTSLIMFILGYCFQFWYPFLIFLFFFLKKANFKKSLSKFKTKWETKNILVKVAEKHIHM